MTAGPRRDDLVLRYLAHAAAADALKRQIRERQERAYVDEGAADTWRLPGVAQVSASIAKDGVSIHDAEAFAGWVAERYPHQVRTRTVTEVINLDWAKKVAAALTPVDPGTVKPGEKTFMVDADGVAVPGVVWRRGGTFISSSVKPDSDLQAVLEDAAEKYAKEGTPMLGLDQPTPKVITEGGDHD